MHAADAPMPLPPIALTLGVAMICQWVLWPLVCTDMVVYLVPWFDHIVAAGPVHAFAAPFSNYTPPYLYLLAATSLLSSVAPAMTLVKALSLLGTLALALAVRVLLIRLGTAQPNRAAALFFALPSIAANAGLLGQCDAIYSAALVMALVAALDRRHGTMLVWCGLALGFKAQAVLLAPFFLVVLINRRVPLHLWTVTPAVAIAAMLPAWLFGWPAADLATIYLRQADTFAALSMNAPNIWSIVQAISSPLPLFGIAVAAAMCGTAAYIVRFSLNPLDDRSLVPAALLCVLIMAGLLPRMHERYFFLADILALVLALTAGDRMSMRIAILVQAGSMLSLFGYLTGFDALAMFGAVCMIPATVSVAKRVLGRATCDRETMVSAA